MSKAGIKVVLLLLTACTVVGLTACIKSEQLKNAGHDPRLTNHYCNDPRAVNYNQGFPGIPDSTVCVYPSDLYAGQWVLTDSVISEDDNIPAQADTNVITFTPTEDSQFVHLKLTGLCGNSNKAIFITTDKYGHATVDSLDSITEGQFFCSSADTVFGDFRFFLTTKDSMNIQLTVKGTHAGHIKGIAGKVQ